MNSNKYRVQIHVICNTIQKSAGNNDFFLDILTNLRFENQIIRGKQRANNQYILKGHADFLIMLLRSLTCI